MNDGSKPPRDAGAASQKHEPLMERLLSLWRPRPVIEQSQASNAVDEVSNHDSGAHERRLISNVAAFRDLTVDDVMVPRAEIVAIEISMELQALLSTVAAAPHSRLPVYRETLDDVIGVFHIKDLLSAIINEAPFDLMRILRPVPIVAPSMRGIDLLLEMRRTRSHMALVVDEFGGIDGLVTIEDLIEQIVGEIEDEHDRDTFLDPVEHEDGTLTIDGRMPIEELEKRFGTLVPEDEREDFDTVGGLIWNLAGHIPTVGEVVRHESGVEFEVIDADQRRIKRVLARHAIPQPAEPERTA